MRLPLRVTSRCLQTCNTLNTAGDNTVGNCVSASELWGRPGDIAGELVVLPQILPVSFRAFHNGITVAKPSGPAKTPVVPSLHSTYDYCEELHVSFKASLDPAPNCGQSPWHRPGYGGAAGSDELAEPVGQGNGGQAHQEVDR